MSQLVQDLKDELAKVRKKEAYILSRLVEVATHAPCTIGQSDGQRLAIAETEAKDLAQHLIDCADEKQQLRDKVNALMTVISEQQLEIQKTKEKLMAVTAQTSK
jgi:hypothetical protein